MGFSRFSRSFVVSPKTLAKHLNIDPSSIVRIGKKQLYIVNNDTVYSYHSRIAEKVGEQWVILKGSRNYSSTTSGHCTFLVKNFDAVYQNL